MADHLGYDEGEKFFGKIGIELCRLGECSEPSDLLGLAGGIRGRKAVGRFELSYGLGTFEALREKMNEGRIDVVDAVAQTLQFGVDRHVARASNRVDPSLLRVDAGGCNRGLTRASRPALDLSQQQQKRAPWTISSHCRAVWPWSPAVH